MWTLLQDAVAQRRLQYDCYPFGSLKKVPREQERLPPQMLENYASRSFFQSGKQKTDEM